MDEGKSLKGGVESMHEHVLGPTQESFSCEPVAGGVVEPARWFLPA